MPRVLVADDNSNIQKMVSLALKDAGIDVVAVGNGEAAVRKMPEVSPDLVLADIFMPVRSGYEVCEFVKHNPKFMHTPVVLLIGAFDPLDEREAQRVQADGVLKKPFVPVEPLVSMVTSLLARTLTERHPAPARAEEPVLVGAPVASEESEMDDPSMMPQNQPAPAINFAGKDKPLAFGALLEQVAEAQEEAPQEASIDELDAVTATRDPILGEPAFWAPEPAAEETAEEEVEAEDGWPNAATEDASLSVSGDVSDAASIDEQLPEVSDVAEMPVAPPVSDGYVNGHATNLPAQPLEPLDEVLTSEPLPVVTPEPLMAAPEIDSLPALEELPELYGNIKSESAVVEEASAAPAPVVEELPAWLDAAGTLNEQASTPASEEMASAQYAEEGVPPDWQEATEKVAAEAADVNSPAPIPAYDWPAPQPPAALESQQAAVEEYVASEGHVARDQAAPPEELLSASSYPLSGPIPPDPFATQPPQESAEIAASAPYQESPSLASAMLLPPSSALSHMDASSAVAEEPVQTPPPVQPALTPEQLDALVSRVVERIQPQLMDLVTREVLRPVAEALVDRELRK